MAIRKITPPMIERSVVDKPRPVVRLKRKPKKTSSVPSKRWYR